MKTKKIISILLLTIITFTLLAGCSNSNSKYKEISGKYYAQNSSDFIEFQANGDFSLNIGKESYKGTFESDNGKITLMIDGGMQSSGLIEENTFVDNDGLKWVKK